MHTALCYYLFCYDIVIAQWQEFMVVNTSCLL